jgi:hypothetical protein
MQPEDTAVHEDTAVRMEGATISGPTTDLGDEIARYPWYHTLDLGGGVVARGMFDHRGFEDRYGLPRDLSGRRCLDVGTMDGFWAF